MLSYDVASGSDIMSCIKIDKPFRGQLYSKFSFEKVCGSGVVLDCIDS